MYSVHHLRFCNIWCFLKYSLPYFHKFDLFPKYRGIFFILTNLKAYPIYFLSILKLSGFRDDLHWNTEVNFLSTTF